MEAQEITTQLLTKMCATKPNASNLKSVVEGLNTFGRQVGLLKPHRLYLYLGQIMHESGTFKYDREIWGPTKAQLGYEGRKDLGNTQKGDGKKFMGRTSIQITGRGNTTRFHKWCLKLGTTLGIAVPDFTKDPDKMNTDPWEGAGPIWYWDVGNPEGKSLNKYADDGNIIMLTKRINGGTNGLADRITCSLRAGLVLAGYGFTEKEIRRFQADHGLQVDGDPGDKTMKKLHEVLGGKNPFKEVVKIEQPIAVKVPEPVTTPELEKPALLSKDGVTQMITGPVGVTAVGWLTDIPTEKILILVGLTVVGLIVWYVIRRMNRNEQKARVEAIRDRAERKIDNIKTDAVRAEAEVENHVRS